MCPRPTRSFPWPPPTVGRRSPRDEIQPEFSYNPTGGPDGSGSLVIRTDQREGLHGYWTRSFPVVGGRYYAFRVLRRAVAVHGG